MSESPPLPPWPAKMKLLAKQRWSETLGMTFIPLADEQAMEQANELLNLASNKLLPDATVDEFDLDESTRSFLAEHRDYWLGDSEQGPPGSARLFGMWYSADTARKERRDMQYNLNLMIHSLHVIQQNDLTSDEEVTFVRHARQMGELNPDPAALEYLDILHALTRRHIQIRESLGENGTRFHCSYIFRDLQRWKYYRNQFAHEVGVARYLDHVNQKPIAVLKRWYEEEIPLVRQAIDEFDALLNDESAWNPTICQPVDVNNDLPPASDQGQEDSESTDAADNQEVGGDSTDSTEGQESVSHDAVDVEALDSTNLEPSIEYDANWEPIDATYRWKRRSRFCLRYFLLPLSPLVFAIPLGYFYPRPTLIASIIYISIVVFVFISVFIIRVLSFACLDSKGRRNIRQHQGTVGTLQLVYAAFPLVSDIIDSWFYRARQLRETVRPNDEEASIAGTEMTQMNRAESGEGTQQSNNRGALQAIGRGLSKVNGSGTVVCLWIGIGCHLAY